MVPVISVENVSKAYRLGAIGGRTLREDFARWWARLRGQPDPFLKVGEEHKQRLVRTAPKGFQALSRSVFQRFRVSASQRLSDDVFWALRNVSFEVKQGEVLGIIGRNGAGKSTLLKILSRVTGPTEGQIRVKGRIASLLEVGTGFHPDLTGRENVFLNGAILGMTKAEIRKKFDEIVAFAEIEEFIDTPVKRYSSGMYVRLAFAVAAHLEPEILIVDEVLAVGDAEFQKKCLGKMESVSRNEGRTILFVSHHMPAVSKLTGRCIVMAKGTPIYTGPTGAAVESYLQATIRIKPLQYDLTSVPRAPGGTNAARFVTAAFCRSKAHFEANEDLEFKVHVRANVHIPSLRFSMTVCAQDGTPVGTSYSSHRPPIRRGEVHAFRIRLPRTRFAPGHYFCIIALGAGSYLEGQVDFDVVPETLHFEVAPEAGLPGVMTYWNATWGRVVLPDIQMQETPKELAGR